MYPYHNRIKQRIQAGELVTYYYTDSYPRIGQALVLVFNTAPYLRPSGRTGGKNTKIL